MSVTEHKTPDVVVSVATGLLMSWTEIPDLFFCFVLFFPLAAADVSLHPPAWVQELQARPPRKRKRKIFI